MERQKFLMLGALVGVIFVGGAGCGPKSDDSGGGSGGSSPLVKKNKLDAADDTGDTPAQTASASPRGGSPMSPGMPSGMPGAPMMPGQPRAGGGGPDPFAVKPAGGAGYEKPVPDTGPRQKRPYDPFYPIWVVKIPPPAVFDAVQPIRIASADVSAPPPVNTEVREVPLRRVSGIMNGEGVYAILEGDGDPEIVKPGSKTRDGYRVVSINSDSVKLQKREGNLLYTQLVKLTDVPVTGAQTAAFRGGYPGAGGMGGRYPGMPGGPGMMGPGNTNGAFGGKE